MNETSSGALITIRPSLPTTTATAVFAMVGFALLMGAGFVGFIVTAVTGRGIVGVGAAAGLWALGMLAFARKLRRNSNDARYEFHSDRMVFTMRDKLKTMRYDEIGHVLFKGGQTLLFSSGFDGLTPRDSMRVDVEVEQGDPRFREVLDLIRRACPNRLFSYETLGRDRVEHSRAITTLPGIEDQKVSRIKTVVGRPAYGETEIVIDDAADPAFTVLRPYEPKRRYYHPALVVIRNDGKERTGRIQDGQVLLGFAGTDISKNLNLEWSHSDIVTRRGVHVGHFRVKQKIVSPFDDFELELLGDTLKLHGDLFDKHYTLKLNDAPVGRMTSRFWSLTKVNEAVFDVPVDLKIALGLALAMNESLLRDDDDDGDD